LMCPLDTVIFRSQGLNPAFFTESWCGPAGTPRVEGVLPTKFPIFRPSIGESTVLFGKTSDPPRNAR
jgi:hypothetical protein